MYGDNLYGQIGYGTTVPDNSSSQRNFIDLMAYLPSFYENIKEMRELQTVLGNEVGDIAFNTEETLNQCFISSATWGLDRWEKVFRIPIDWSKSYERRREILLSKLRGSGTTTKDMIKNVAKAFSGGEVNVLEYPEEYRFVVQFIGVKGIPQNMTGLMAALDEIKPAHLVYSFKYTYSTWGQLSMTWGEVNPKTWVELRIYEGE